MQQVNLPAFDHESVLLGKHRPFVEVWNEIVSNFDNDLVMKYHGQTGIDAASAFSVLAYAHVARAAYCLAAIVVDRENLATFDPDEFGRRCADIAREQIARCPQANSEDSQQTTN